MSKPFFDSINTQNGNFIRTFSANGNFNDTYSCQISTIIKNTNLTPTEKITELRKIQNNIKMLNSHITFPNCNCNCNC